MNLPSLPKTAGPWTRPDTPRRIDETTIFSYMDGAGEMYVGYRFDHLDVFEYTAAGRDPILVELYWMKTSDDAFGLLSNDWGGEPIVLQADINSEPRQSPPRALYGAGLLRLWSDNLYARVLASRETPESREQVIGLGRAIVAGRRLSDVPRLALLVRPTVGRFSVRTDRLWFLRSHLVLNSAYFLSSQNILDLSLQCEAVVAAYEGVGAQRPAGARTLRPHLIMVEYPDATAARRAFEHFVAAYLPEVRVVAAPPGSETRLAHRVEHGWAACRLTSRLLLIALDAPDENTATSMTELVMAR